MKVITIGTDRKLFEENSAVLSRSISYAQKMEELHIVVFSLKSHNLKMKKIDNLYIYPTNSINRFGYILSAYFLGKKIIVENKFVRGLSVITAQDPFESGLSAWMLKVKFRLPIQLQVHTDFLSPYFKNSFLNRIRFVFAKFLIPKAEGLRVVSDKIANSLKSNFSNLKSFPTILPIFVDISAIENTPITRDLKKEFPQFNFILFMASRMTREKRIDTALYVLKNLVVQFPYTGLIIAGEGSEKGNLENLVKKLGLEKNVVFIGWSDNLVSLYKTANMFLLTSEFEGYGMTIIEASAAGCPVLTTKVGIAENLLVQGENALICPVGDVDCFVGKIAGFISNNTERYLIKQYAKISISKMTITREQYVLDYVSALEKLLKPLPKNI